MTRRPESTERGSALTATLAATAVLLPLAALAALLARTNFYVQQNTRAQAEAFYTADAGAEHALAEMPPAATFGDLLNGPDRIHGTGDDGVFPFREATTGYFPAEPLRYQVRIEQVNNTLLRVTSTADGRRNAHAVIEVLVGRDPAPFVPGAIYAPGGVVLSVGSDTLVSGFDHATGDAPDHPTGGGSPLPALGIAEGDAGGPVHAQLVSSEPDRLVGKGDRPSVADVEPIALDELIEQLAATAGTIRLSGNSLVAGSQLGTPSAPQITVVLDPTEITGPVSGAGVLIAMGELRISGSLDFEGLVFIRSALNVSETGSVRVTGSLWVDGYSADVRLSGRGAVVYSRDAMVAVDRWLAGRLPHALIVQSWREVL